MALLESEGISRESIINRVRQELLRVTGSDQSICRAAADRGIFCRGFSQFSEADLRQRLPWIARRRPEMNQAELASWATVGSWRDRKSMACRARATFRTGSRISAGVGTISRMKTCFTSTTKCVVRRRSLQRLKIILRANMRCDATAPRASALPPAPASTATTPFSNTSAIDVHLRDHWEAPAASTA